MATLIQETPDLDTSGYASHYDSIYDVLTLPNARVQRLDTNQVNQAYIHIDSLGRAEMKFDHDTFVADLDASRSYRMMITPENPEVVKYNKIATVMEPGRPFYETKFILNTTDGYVDGAIFSDIFSPSRSGDHFVTVSMNVFGPDVSSTTVAEPYAIVVYDIQAGPPDFSTTPGAPQTISREQAEKISLLYAAALDREPDAPGLNYWIEEFSAGVPIPGIARSFVDSHEFTSRFEVETNRGYIEQLYSNVLKRAADEDGVQYFLTDMAAGQTREDILVSFAQSDENRGNAAEWLAGLQYDANIGEWVV